MADINGIGASQPANASVQPTAGVVKPDAQTAGLAATANKNNYDSSTTISGTKDLPPKLRDAMYMGIAQNIVHDLRQAEEHRKKMAKEYQR